MGDDIDITVPDISERSDGSGSSDFSVDDFLAGVEEADRPTVEKYFKDWGGTVTQHIQSIHEEYQPYKDLGADVTQIGSALSIMQMADSDPVGFYNYVRETLLEMGHDLDMSGTGDDTPTFETPPEYDGLPEPVVQQMQTMQEQLGQLTEFVTQTKSQQEAASNAQQLDTLMESLHTEHGAFDDAAILGRMAQGMEPEDAVKDYQKVLSEISNPRPTPPPTLKTGGTPVDQVDQNKLKDQKFRKKFVTDRLAAAAQE